MDKALKQRLVGATVLVALAVVVLPMLLGGQPETQQEAQTIELPPRPGELSFQTRRFPVGDQDPATPSELPPAPPTTLPVPVAPAQRPVTGAEVAQDPPPADPGAPPTPAGDIPGEGAEDVSPAVTTAASPPGATPTEPAPAEPAAVEQEPSPVLAAPAAPAGGRYLVQVASFSSTGNADRLSARLREQGLAVLNDTVQSDAGVLHRVRLGPYATQEEADRVVQQLTRQMSDLRPRVLDLRPDQGAPATASSDPLVRWVVQVGSFSERENADQLVFRLRDSGYRASSAMVSSGGATSYKVRVGPVIDRADAVALAEDIRGSLGIDGLVMSAD